MKALLIDPTAREIREVETDGSDASLRALLGGEGLISGRLNEWGGKLAVSVTPDESSGFFFLQGIPQPIGGRGVVFESNKTIEQVREGIRFIARKELQDFIKAIVETVNPAMDKLVSAMSKAGVPAKQEEPKPEKALPSDIKPEIKGETRAMLDILSDKVGGRR